MAVDFAVYRGVRGIEAALTSEPVLVHFDTAAETVVDCDASQTALGCVLLQVQDGVERPVAFASRVLNEHELGYSVSEKEALACIYACEHWHYYLYGRKFKLRTDHSVLTTLLRKGDGRRPLRLQRWHDRFTGIRLMWSTSLAVSIALQIC
jgi:hypothetical protein